MARSIRSSSLESRTGRLKLASRWKPYTARVAPGVRLGYRRNKTAGRWSVIAADGKGGAWMKAFAEADDFEALPEETELSVVCFRHLPGGRDAALKMPAAKLDAHQDRLQATLEASGDGWLTATRLRGATDLRAGIVNSLATEDDIDHLLDTLRGLAEAR